MSCIDVNAPHGGPEVEILDAKTTSTAFGPYEVTGLMEPDLTTSPTGVREELVLLAWLLTLLRTREEGQVTYHWAYATREGTVDEPSCMKLSSVDVLPDLQSNVSQAAVAISHHITTSPKPAAGLTRPASLLLSTGPLTRDSKGANDEPVLQLEIHLDDAALRVHPVWHSEGIYPFTIQRHVETLIDTITACISAPETVIQELLSPTSHDLETIWRWNQHVPPTYDRCMHDVIQERASTCPDKVGIDSWDGSLTYAQIDRYSTFLAQVLQNDYGVQLHDFLPVCFEKSRWTIVAVLAVMKAGATLVMMDPSLPLARLQNMGTQVGAEVMISSVFQQSLAHEILPEGKHITLSQDTFTSIPPSFLHTPPALPDVPPSALMYIIFTSGSTGTPKGVQISHCTYTSSAYPRAAAVGYSPSSRVLDFASYAFDVSIDSMLLTLANGGTLCIPSDEDRLNDINGVIRQMGINYAGITPSVARILDLDVIASMEALGLGGEAASAMDVNTWGKLTRIVIGYGPCECTIGCTVNGSAATGRDYITIGPGNGAAMWVVDPNDHDKLMPVGAVGELLVEGPIVGQGYLFDEEKTKAAFIHDPAWLVKGHRQHEGRRGRLYKTGDLGRYDPFGTGEIVFVGRKDTQVKLRGQRVELGEIESQLKARLPADVNVIAEVIAPLGSAKAQHTLVAFVAKQTTKRDDTKEIELEQLKPEMGEAVAKANAEVAEVLPRYMVPNAYIPVNFIPTLISGKTDRKRLRQFGTTVDLRLLAEQAPTTGLAEVSKPLTEMGKRLQQAWATILKLDAAAIRSEDNFFALGGDSVAAMKLVTLCREQGLDLSVTSTFGHPTLSAMAEVTHAIDETSPTDDRAPFAMAPVNVESILPEAAELCATRPTKIQDIYPCTPTQESLFTFSLKSTEAYIAQRVARIPAHIAVDEWKTAWQTVVSATPVLRTRLVQLQDNPALLQVVLEENIAWHHSTTSLTEYLAQDGSKKMSLGEPLVRYAIISSSPSEHHFVLTLHHVVYDGWSEPLLQQSVLSALQPTPESAAPALSPMADFVKYCLSTSPEEMTSFWRKELDGATASQFPAVPDRDFLPRPSAAIEREVSLPEVTCGEGRFPFTPAALIRAAWALVSSVHSGSSDIVFGETLMGRDIPIPGVESIVGPMIATVPVRVRVGYGLSISSYLQSVQDGVLERSHYQHLGMQNIRKVSRAAQYACETPMGIVIQPEADYTIGDELGFQRSDPVEEAVRFNPYSLMLAFGLKKNGGFRVCASFDERVVGRKRVDRVLGELEVVCNELRHGLERSVGEVRGVLGGEELDSIWERNATQPMHFDAMKAVLRATSGIKTGDTYPKALVPWVVNARNPMWLASVGCPGELWLEGPRALLTGEGAVENPAWLVAGSPSVPGRFGWVQPTGDIVRLEEDGTLIFVGRKEDVAGDDGHAIDVAGLEAHIDKHLGRNVRAAAVAVKGEGEAGRQLLVFIEETIEGDVELIQNTGALTVRLDDAIEVMVHTKISTDFATRLKKFDKFAQNSLPSHLVPSGYIILAKLPSTDDTINRSLLRQLAPKISPATLSQLQSGLHLAWTTNLSDSTLSPAETILRSAWSHILSIPSSQIDIDDNFFRLGGDSVLAMKLVSYLRQQGHALSVAEIFQKMRLGDAAKVLKLDHVQMVSKAEVYKPFSTLGELDVQEFVEEVIKPRLAEASWEVQDVLPVMDVQAMDVRATINPPRTSVQYTNLTFADDIHKERLVGACKELVRRHDILRTVFVEYEETLLQVVISNLEATVETHQTDGDLEVFVKDLCNKHIDSDSNFKLGAPFFSFIHTSSSSSSSRHTLTISLSHALYDGVSLPLFLRHLSALYCSASLPPSLPFSTYISHTTSPVTLSPAKTYFRSLLSGSKLPTLPDLSLSSSITPQTRSIFETLPISLPESTPREMTTSTLLTASWALLLSRRLRTNDVTVFSVRSGREISAPFNTDEVMGPTYNFIPIRVRFTPGLTGAELLSQIQDQAAKSAEHSHIGYETITNECTEWDSNTLAQGTWSLVNHQDWEDFDDMQFGNEGGKHGGRAKVGIEQPHGDAPWPVKIVSYVNKEGRLEVGVVGVEVDKKVVKGLVRELKRCVESVAGLGDRLVEVGRDEAEEVAAGDGEKVEFREEGVKPEPSAETPIAGQGREVAKDDKKISPEKVTGGDESKSVETGEKELVVEMVVAGEGSKTSEEVDSSSGLEASDLLPEKFAKDTGRDAQPTPGWFRRIRSAGRLRRSMSKLLRRGSSWQGEVSPVREGR